MPRGNPDAVHYPVALIGPAVMSMNNIAEHSRAAAQRDTASILERVSALRDLIEAQAAANEDATELSDVVLDALEQTDVFKIMAPRTLGGLEAHPLLVLEVLRALSYFDGSTGWYCQAATTGVAVAGAFLGERAIEEIFHSSRRATCAGQAAPTGKAERVGDGYRISGTFSFGSGLPNASWVVGGYILHKDGVPVRRENGAPVMLIALAPRAKVDLLGNWHVLGLRGTGSYDFRVQEQIIHRDFAFEAGVDLPQRGGALYRMGFMAIPSLCHSGFGLGCTRRVLDEWVSHARTKKRIPDGTLSDLDSFQKDLAQSHARLRSADAYIRDTFAKLFVAAEQGTIPGDLALDGRLCASNIIAAGARIGQTAFTSSATAGLRNGSKIQRCFRDLQAGNAHFMTGEQALISAGRYLAGLPGAQPGL